MRQKVFGIVAALSFLVLTAVPALAHHSFAAEFDGAKLITYSGVLTKIDWQNPHSYFYVDVKDANGKLTTWAFETASPAVLSRQDEDTRHYFVEDIGKVISVTACPAKNGLPRAAAEDVKFSDGRIVPMGAKRYTGDLDSEQILKNLK